MEEFCEPEALTTLWFRVWTSQQTGLGPPWESLFGEIRPGVLWAFVLLHNKSPVQSIKEKVDFATQKAEDGIGTGFEEWD